MVETNIEDLETYDCPLIKGEIHLGDCYDIQMIRMRCVKMEASLQSFDREQADGLCPKCPYNQLKG